MRRFGKRGVAAESDALVPGVGAYGRTHGEALPWVTPGAVLRPAASFGMPPGAVLRGGVSAPEAVPRGGVSLPGAVGGPSSAVVPDEGSRFAAVAPDVVPHAVVVVSRGCSSPVAGGRLGRGGTAGRGGTSGRGGIEPRRASVLMHPPFPCAPGRRSRTRAVVCVPGRPGADAVVRSGHAYPHGRTGIPARLPGRSRPPCVRVTLRLVPGRTGTSPRPLRHLPGTSPYPAVIPSGRLRS